MSKLCPFVFLGVRLLRCVPVPVLRPSPPRRDSGAGVEKQHHGLRHALPHTSHARVYHKGTDNHSLPVCLFLCYSLGPIRGHVPINSHASRH